LNNCSIVACTPPYSVVLSLTAPDMQMVVVPAMRIRATTDIATVNFTVFPRFLPDGKAICQGGEADYALLG